MQPSKVLSREVDHGPHSQAISSRAETIDLRTVSWVFAMDYERWFGVRSDWSGTAKADVSDS